MDSTTGKILVISESDPSQGAPVTLAVTQELIFANGTAVGPVLWHGIAFEHTAVETATCFSTDCDAQSAAFLTTAAVQMFGASGWNFSNCSFAHTGGYAIWFNAGTVNSGVFSSAMTDLGAGGVRIGTMSGTSQATSGITVSDNVLSHGGFVYQEGCGVLSQNSVSNVRIMHNEISYFRYTGVSTGWTWGYGPTAVKSIYTGYNHIYQIGMGCAFPSLAVRDVST